MTQALKTDSFTISILYTNHSFEAMYIILCLAKQNQLLTDKKIEDNNIHCGRVLNEFLYTFLITSLSITYNLSKVNISLL